MKRVGIFIDVSNLYFCLSRKYASRRLNYQKYLDFCKGLGDIQQAIAYGCYDAKRPESFIKALEGIGFQTKYKPIKRIFKQGVLEKIKGDWDVGMSVAIMQMLDRLDVIILGSADSDMKDLVEFARTRGIQVIVLACQVSSELHDVCTEVIEIPESMLEAHENDRNHTTVARKVTRKTTNRNRVQGDKQDKSHVDGNTDEVYRRQIEVKR
jgi:uncharacterized LabA/DUF88 family protein